MDKLTSAVTVKFAPDDADDLHALASSRGMEVSEYIRHLVLADREEARRQFDALSRIFGRERETDKENRG
jgi:hypothetical protein